CSSDLTRTGCLTRVIPVHSGKRRSARWPFPNHESRPGSQSAAARGVNITGRCDEDVSTTGLADIVRQNGIVIHRGPDPSDWIPFADEPQRIVLGGPIWEEVVEVAARQKAP